MGFIKRVRQGFRRNPGVSPLGDGIGRGQAQIGLITGFVGLVMAAPPAIAIIDVVTISPPRAQAATPSPAVWLEAVVVMVLLAITFVVFLYIYEGAL